MSNSIIVNPVSLILLPENPNGELSDTIYRVCSFCCKNKEILSSSSKINKRMSGNSYYCSFCLRHGYNTKLKPHILIMSFCNVFEYYYLEHHACRTMWLSEIVDLVKIHEKTGLQNPVFSYDSETMLWFVNFAKVGNSRKKIALDEVLKTTLDILNCFQNIVGLNMQTFYEKYREAIIAFYCKRYRPKHKKILSPTFKNCLNEQKTTEFYQKTKAFNLEEILKNLLT